MNFGKVVEVSGEDTEQLLYLARAVLIDLDLPTKTALKYLYFEPTEKEGELLGIATDGRQLHLTILSADFVNEHGLFAGYWKIIKAKQNKRYIWLINIDKPENDYVFPKYKKIIPNTEDAKYKTTFEGSGSFNMNLAILLHGFPDVTAINPDYLRLLGEGTWEVYWYEQNKAIKFIQDDKVALIMPLQIEKEEEK